MSYRGAAPSERGFVCPSCFSPLSVIKTWSASRGLVKRSRRCDNPACGYLAARGESYRETTEERRPLPPRPVIPLKAAEPPPATAGR